MKQTLSPRLTALPLDGQCEISPPKTMKLHRPLWSLVVLALASASIASAQAASAPGKSAASTSTAIQLAPSGADTGKETGNVANDVAAGGRLNANRRETPADGSSHSHRAAERWPPLWDGQTLAGWHIIGKGEWKIEHGALHGTNTKSEKEYGHLVSDKTYGDFTVRLKFKSLAGNSGFYFRIEEKGFSGVTGFQAEIDATVDVGGLYDTNGRSWVSQPTPAQVATWFKPGEWSEMTVSAKGGHVVVQINGKKSAELPNDPGRREGRFALQVHGGMDCDVWFKDLEIQIP